MKNKTRWTLTGILTYCLFAAITFGFNLLSPSRIGVTWTVFWYIAAALIIYYLCFKNYVFRRMLYNARQLHMTKDELAEMLPDIKQSQDIPNPQRHQPFSPLFTFSLQNLDKLDQELQKKATEHGIEPYE
ncbi:hypothetical protein [Lentilactobacillus sp. SPB1-3]|uniref:Uncharacterized protein n=1 Tax=Lentilactobacillus terminaliae TaxID=3003483 RepID=A0ACD5DEH4_9LACO|nr:hypothetical protein [Lentilactobacillus sp. SPB1-3]MCZ0977506.1 hypothetical protein [Lentilactobacillus sp. SPB1-3]